MHCSAGLCRADPGLAADGGEGVLPGGQAGRPCRLQQTLKDRFREYTEALIKRDLAALDKIWAEGYTFTNGRGELLTKKERMEN
ncbi:MAG: nuclear transport factor 2 family protein, partial [Gammaproteobacteria bacterium]